MARTYTQIIELTSQILQDTGNAKWTTTELDLLLQTCLEEISNYKPRKVKETTTCTAGSREITLTDENKRNLVYLTGKEDDTPSVEYPVGEDPPSYRNVLRFEDIITMQLDYAPSSAVSVYLFLAKNHLLQKEIGTDDLAGEVKTQGEIGETTLALNELGSGTINENTRLSIDGDDTVYTVTEQATIDTNEATVKITPALAAIAAAETVVNLSLHPSTLDSRLERYLAELLAGRAAINKANTAYQKVLSAISDLSRINNSVSGMDDLITSAVSDITEGRSHINGLSGIITSIETALGKIATQVDQAVTDLDAGRDLIGAIDIARSIDYYGKYAQDGVNNARSYINEASGFLQQASLEQNTGTHLATLASHSLSAANASMNQGIAYLRKADLELAVSRAATNLERWGQNKVAETLSQLRRLAIGRGTRLFARD